MCDSSKYFGMERGGSPSSHWLPANAASFQSPSSIYFDDTSLDNSLDPGKSQTSASSIDLFWCKLFVSFDVAFCEIMTDFLEVDPAEHDAAYIKKMEEFESTVQEKLKEELREEESEFCRSSHHS